jgi:phospholipid/cholesterol/gamma-HCH transport system substrate-binding protein
MAELKQPEPEEEEEIVTVALDPRAWIRVTVLISFAMAVLAVLIYVLSGGGKDLFQRRVKLRTYFPDGGGLENKAMVELDGIKVGRIDSVELSHSIEPSRVVRVNILLNQKYLSFIPVDSQTEVTADNLLGDKYVNIHKGVASEAVKAGDELFARPPSNDFNPADLIASLKQVLNQAIAILDNIDDPSTQIGQLVKGEVLYDQLLGYVAAIQRTVHQVGNPKSPAGQAVFGTALYDQFIEPFVDFDKRLAAIQSGEGAVGHLYASSEQYDSVKAQTAAFRKSVVDLKANKLLTSDEQYRGLMESVRALNAMVTALSTGPMFENTQLYESLGGSSKNTEKFLREFRNNPQKFLRLKVF